VPGIADGSGKVYATLSEREISGLLASRVISGGMIPKVNACLKAIQAGVVARIIDGRPSHALINELTTSPGGTTVVG